MRKFSKPKYRRPLNSVRLIISADNWHLNNTHVTDKPFYRFQPLISLRNQIFIAFRHCWRLKEFSFLFFFLKKQTKSIDLVEMLNNFALDAASKENFKRKKKGEDATLVKRYIMYVDGRDKDRLDHAILKSCTHSDTFFVGSLTKK